MSIKDLPLKVIVTLSINLIESKQFDYSSPYDDFSKNESELYTQSKWTATDVVSEDVEFIAAFINLNFELLEKVINEEVKVKDILPEIEIPKKSKYKIDYSVWGPATLTEYYDKEWYSYDEDWAGESLKQNYWEGDFYYYDGNYRSMDSDNFDPENFEIDHVREITESKKTNKTIVENTGKVIDTLDKETLLQLKKIIDSKLKSL